MIADRAKKGKSGAHVIRRGDKKDSPKAAARTAPKSEKRHVLKDNQKNVTETASKVDVLTKDPSGKRIKSLPKKKSTSKKLSKEGKRRAMIAGGIIAGVMMVLMLSLGGFTYLYPNIFPGVTVGSIPVGGMNDAEAVQVIEQKSGPLYEDASVSVTIYEKDYAIPVSDVLQSIDFEQSVQNARDIGRTGNFFQRITQVAGALFGGGDAQLAATVDSEGLTKNLEEIAAEALTEPVEPTWEIGTDTLTIHSGKPGVQFDTEGVRAALDEKIRLMDFKPYEVTTELTETPAIDINAIAEAVIGGAVNATVNKEDGQTIIPEKTGVDFDIEKAKEIIGDGSAETYSIPITATMPQVTAADLKEKLFRDTLASASTDLNEGNVPRTNNIRLASKAINGTILNPGDEFSYNNVVGERTEARGYKPAGAYSGGQIIEEYGGGVCQPSSTLYMAVLRADLEVTERSNHSFTVSYTPLGEDATVSWGGPDFRFRNNTIYPVKILAEQTNGQMIMTIVGTKTDDKTVSTRTEVLETYSPQTIERTDGSMSAGQTRVEQTGITGYATRTYKQITVNGETNEVLANTSSYSKRDKIVYVGTKSAPAPAPTPSTPEPQPSTQADPEPASDPEPPASEPESSGASEPAPEPDPEPAPVESGEGQG